MYYRLYESFLKSAKPFHNNMLRSNYDVSRDTLLSVIMDVLGAVNDKDSVLFAKDGFENGEYSYEEVQKIPADRDSILNAMISCQGDLDGAGFFDEALSFYIRASLEPDENVDEKSQEQPCGIFEFYAGDGDIDDLFKTLNQKYDLFIVKEGSKKRLMDISL